MLRHYLIFAILLSLSCKEANKLPDPLEAGWEGQKVCEVLEETDTYRVLKCTFAPGVGHEQHEHIPHFGYTIQGSRFRITDSKGMREVDVPSGYTFSNQENIIHEVLNVGDSTAVYIIMEIK